MHPGAILLCRFSEQLEEELARRLRLVRFGDTSDEQRRALLAAEGNRHGEECERGDEIAILCTNGKFGCPSSLIAALPSLRLIAIHGVGYDRIDRDLCAARGIAIANTPHAIAEDVADLAVGLTIALLRRLPAADRFVRDGLWRDGVNGFLPMSRRVAGKRFGIVGLGRIGAAIARRLAPFGPVGYCSRTAKDGGWTRYPGPAELAAASDVLIIACAATPETRGLIDDRVLAALGRDGYLINIARSAVVDEAALRRRLATGALAGAALDVFDNEPQIADDLRTSERTVLSPHAGSATFEARAAMAAALLQNIDAFLAGKSPPGLVPPPIAG